MIQSAGIAIIDFFEEESPKVLCLRAYGLWDFPKGKLEETEDLITAAKRETQEESGLSVEDFQVLDVNPVSIQYRVGKNEKEATYFFAKRTSKKLPTLPVNPSLGRPEHDEWRWIPVKDLQNIMPRRLTPILEALLPLAFKDSSE